MRDRTAMTEPLTIGQRLVARWESMSSGWSAPADLAEAIDAATAAEREACAKIAAEYAQRALYGQNPCDEAGMAARHIAEAIMKREQLEG